MNREAIGAGGKNLGAIAVLITLVNLPTQVRPSNDLSRFNALKEILNQFNELNRLVITDSELRQVLTKPGKHPADEREQVYNFTMMFCDVWLSTQMTYDNGQIVPEFYAAGARDVRIEIERWPNFHVAVRTWLTNDPEIADYSIIQSAVRSGDPQFNTTGRDSGNDKRRRGKANWHPMRPNSACRRSLRGADLRKFRTN